MLPDSMYEYRYERNGGALRCHCCDDEIKHGNYYYIIDDKNYCFNCIEDSKFVAGVD